MKEIMLTKEDVTIIESVVNKAIKGVEEKFDTRFDGLEGRMSNVEQDIREIKVDLLENNIIPRLNTIEQCYLDTSKRYTESADKFDAAIVDIEVMKLAIQKNSADIQALKKKQA